jgi:hypothetical protein
MMDFYIGVIAASCFWAAWSLSNIKFDLREIKRHLTKDKQ